MGIIQDDIICDSWRSAPPSNRFTGRLIDKNNKNYVRHFVDGIEVSAGRGSRHQNAINIWHQNLYKRYKNTEHEGEILAFILAGE